VKIVVLFGKSLVHPLMVHADYNIPANKIYGITTTTTSFAV
jgi:hypothetical protein